MAELNNQITDDSLKEKVNASSFTDEMKKKLEGVIPSMDEGERSQLIDILSREESGRKEFEEEKMEKLAKLNKDFETETSNLEHEELRSAREGFEKMDKEDANEELENIEAEINREETVKTQTKTVTTEQVNKSTTKKHGVRNFILILIALLTVIGVIATLILNI